MGALLRMLERDLKVAQIDRLHFARFAHIRMEGDQTPQQHKSTGAPRVQKLFQLDELVKLPELPHEIPHPGPSTERVALEGGRYPSKQKLKEPRREPSGLDSSCATASDGGVPTSLPSQPLRP